MKKFQNKYRIPSARLQSWDYGTNAAYFITICTHNRAHFFGDILDGIMQLNEIGQLAEKYWMEIPLHFPFVKLGNFVVMPNHTHGILIINKSDDDTPIAPVQTLHCNVCTISPNGPIFPKNEKMAKISPKPGTIPTIIRSYKSIITKNARLICPDFNWHPRFHDHIIRDAQSFENIQNYITNNPINWKKPAQTLHRNISSPHTNNTPTPPYLN